MIRIILIIIALSAPFLNVQGQSNEYFKHGEGWADIGYGAEGNTFYSYVFQVGDTILNNDTLVKLKKPYTVYDTTYYLAKSHLGVLTAYYSNSNFTSIDDSLIIDYSRSDSITQWIYTSMGGAYYSGKAINSIDTVYFGTVARKVFDINDDCIFSGYDDYVYEGVFGFYESCFESINLLTCYSIFDSAYQVNFNTFTYFSGSCSINLGIEELNSENKKIVKVVDLMGREAIEKPNELFIYIYNDGTTEKVFSVE